MPNELAASENPELAASLGNDYIIKPDIAIFRGLVTDEEINRDVTLAAPLGSRLNELDDLPTIWLRFAGLLRLWLAVGLAVGFFFGALVGALPSLMTGRQSLIPRPQPAFDVKTGLPDGRTIISSSVEDLQTVFQNKTTTDAVNV
jgi:hypothetical protein